MLRRRALFILCLSLLSPHLHAATTPADQKTEYLIIADEINNNEKTAITNASGHVDIMDGEQVLQAGAVSIDKKNDVVTARGDVVVIQKDNSQVFTKEAQLTQDFAQGFLQQPAMLMTDNSRFIARSGRRAQGRYMVFENGVYSPCDLCKSDPRKPPLWQVKAKKVTHDNVEKNIIYRDATMEMWGVPMFYTPYFSTPDPTVKRRQGFLTPSFGQSSTLGTFVRVPYYFDISPDADYTLTPTFSGVDGVRYAGILRKRFAHGAVEFNHSLVIADRVDDDGTTKKNQIRGHMAGFARFDIDPVFRAGTTYAITTDKSYLSRYSQPLGDTLENRVYLEGFKGRHFGALEFFYFQDNRPGARPEQPLVLPRMRFVALGEPNMMLGGRWSFDGIATALQRDDGASTRKFGLSFGWDKRTILPGGVVSTLHGEVRNDFFWVENFTNTSTGDHFKSDQANRLMPAGQAALSYPLAAYYNGFSHVIEPVAALTASPTRARDGRIPNEDSLDVEFDTTNLFDINRYPGSDQQEQGTRLAYGLRTGIYGDKGGMAELTFGQNYRITADPLFPTASGLDTNFSDYVGNVRLEPAAWLRLDYLFRLDKNGLEPRKHDVRARFGVAEFMPYVDYTDINPPQIGIAPVAGRVQELKYGFTTNFTTFWTFAAHQTRSLLAPNDGPRTTSFGLTYADECYSASFNFTRDHTARTDIKSGDTFFLRIYFKNIGGLETGG